jgi:hypothetical protein
MQRAHQFDRLARVNAERIAGIILQDQRGWTRMSVEFQWSSRPGRIKDGCEIKFVLEASDAFGGGLSGNERQDGPAIVRLPSTVQHELVIFSQGLKMISAEIHCEPAEFLALGIDPSIARA